MFGTNLQPRHRLFTAFKVPVFADTSAIFLLLLILVLYGKGGPAQMVASVVVAFVAFVSLIGHELGHALAVRRLGYGKSEIILGGLGGVCRWSGHPTRGDMIRIALAGPAVSLALGAIGLVLFVSLRSSVASVYPLYVLLMAMAWLNLLWGLFNLLPIFPMDGGRALRSALQFKMSIGEAARRSLMISGAVGVGLIVVSVLTGHWIIGLVVAMLLFQNWNEWQRL